MLVVDSLERERERNLYIWRCGSLSGSHEDVYHYNILLMWMFWVLEISTVVNFIDFHLDCNFFISFLVIFCLSHVHFLFTQGSNFYSIKFCYLYKNFIINEWKILLTSNHWQYGVLFLYSNLIGNIFDLDWFVKWNQLCPTLCDGNCEYAITKRPLFSGLGEAIMMLIILILLQLDWT